jgi:osmoprotectant transport system ATP-binding protein
MTANPPEISIRFNEVKYRVHGTPAENRAAAQAYTKRYAERQALRPGKRRPEPSLWIAGQRAEAGGAGDTQGRVLIANISLEIRAGQTVVLLGRSGSGKTTLLRLINRMLEPTSGEVLVQGRATTEWNPFELRRGIGYVIQEAGLFPHFTVAENIALVPSLEKWDKPRIAARVKELLRLVGLDGEDFAARYPRQLSGGQRQRVGVARALAADPQILLMDEPFGALDPVTRAELQREFGALAKRLGRTIVFVTHDLREALLLGTRIVLLQDGKIVASETPQEFLKLRDAEVRAFADSLNSSSAGNRAAKEQAAPEQQPGGQLW